MNRREDEQNILIVTESDKGGIAKPCQTWTDYVFEFETKIVNKYTSWIVRAADIENYMMLQCGQKTLRLVFRGKGTWRHRDWTEANRDGSPVCDRLGHYLWAIKL